MMRYLFLDGEMGGGELEYSLLTMYFSVTDSEFNELGNLYLRVKPDDGKYILSGPGMQVNRIDLLEHDRIAVPYKDAKTTLYKFLKQMSEDGRIKLIPVGHGVKGDIDHILLHLLAPRTWQALVSFRYIDTGVILQFLRAAGHLPIFIDGSVSGLAAHFGIDVDPQRLHDAAYDTALTAGVYRKMLELVARPAEGVRDGAGTGTPSERGRLAEECAKLDPSFEQSMADEGLAEEGNSWPK